MLGRLTWVQRSLLVAAILTIIWMSWSVENLRMRIVRDTVIYIIAPLAVGVAHGRHIGWRIDRRAVIDAIALSAFVFPIYIIGSVLPTIRAFYPMWHVEPTLPSFVPHALTLLLLALAMETYFRGMLCVGVREIGFKCIFISPVLYALIHLEKPPIELVLSGPTDALWGAVDYHANSILPSTVAHGGGLILLDWLVLHDPIVPPERVLRVLSWVPIPL